MYTYICIHIYIYIYIHRTGVRKIQGLEFRIRKRYCDGSREYCAASEAARLVAGAKNI